ncbi:mutator type transposase, partial [Tanacetum coccineum]
MAKERQQWVVRDDDDEDLMQKMFMMKVNHGGSFTPKGGREYVLGSNQDVKELLKYVVRNNVIEVYIEHDSTTLDTYYNRPRDGVLTDENMPSSPYDSKGFTRFPLQIPPSSKPLTIGEEIQSKPSEIPWLEREDYGDDIVVVVAKYYNENREKVEAQRKSILGEVEKEVDTKFKSDDNLEHEEEYFEMNDDSDRMTEDVPVDMQPFKNDMEKNDTLVRISDIKQSQIDVSEVDLDVIDLDSFGSDLESIDRGMFNFFVGLRFDNRELVKDRIRKHSVKSRRKLSITKNDNERVRAICVGIMPTYSSFDPDLYFSQASNGGPIIKERQENGKVKDKSPSRNLLNCGKVVRQNKKGDKGKGKMVIANEDDGHKCKWSLLVTLQHDGRDYALELMKENPDTTGIKASGRDILRLEGCFMKGPYPGQILTGVGVDANNGIYLVAYAVVEAVTKSSWCWFLKLLGLDLDIAENYNFTFISDRQKLQWRGGTGYSLKDKNEAKTDKTEHENEKSVKSQANQSKGQQKSNSTKVKVDKVKVKAEIEEILNGLTRTHLMGQ